MSSVRGSLLAASVAISAPAFGCASLGTSTAASAEWHRLEELIQGVGREYAVPALAAAIVRDGDIVAAAVGVRRIDQDVPVDLNDRFHIGSVSKPISATVLAILVEKHLLDWRTTVAEVFPDLGSRVNTAYSGVTLEQLLSHRAGIVTWEEDQEIALAPSVTGSPKQRRRAAVRWLLTQSPLAAPGTKHIYSNAGYLIAAAMAEEVTGVAWEQLVLENLARPLGLKSLGFGWPTDVDAAQPWGHISSPSGFLPRAPRESYEAGPLLGPAGDLHMSIMDLARFARLHLEGLRGRARLLSAQTFRKLHRPIGDYALGWNVRETADHHLGGLGTFLAAIWVSVPRNVAVVVATNADADERIVSAVINRSLRAFEVPRHDPRPAGLNTVPFPQP